MNPIQRVGLIVPSSNTTVETEMPQLLRRHPDATFSFHSSRMRLKNVSPEELTGMNAQRERCVDEVLDAGVDVVLYACLVALMAEGYDAHRRSEDAVTEQLRANGSTATVLSSAGALLEAANALGARKLAMVTPYMKPLARRVVDYVEAAGLEVSDWRTLEVEDNRAVGCIDGDRVMAAAADLDLRDADALVLSMCVQMPSLPLIAEAEARFGLPVFTAATAGAFVTLDRLGLRPHLQNAGSLLSGELVTTTRGAT